MSNINAGELLLPYQSVEAGPYWEGTAKGELRVQRCLDTGRLLFPPSPFSPWGRRRRPEWVTVSGRGRIWSFIVAHGPLMRQFADAAPYVVVTVELDEDPRCRMVGPLVAAPGAGLGSVPAGEVKIGQAVAVDLTPWPTADCVVPRWTPH